jgi:hypothetical protein
VVRRAFYDPPPALVVECGVFADMLALGRRAEITSSEALGTVDADRSTGKTGLVRLDNPDAILYALTTRAMGFYLRWFPDARKPNSQPLVIMPTFETRRVNLAGEFQKIPGLTVRHASYETIVSTGESDYQCFFCRKSLYTKPKGKRVSKQMTAWKKMIAHAEECAVRMIAGLQKPVPPRERGEMGL